MKILSLVFNEEGYKRDSEDKDKSIQEISKLVINNIILNYAAQKQGLDEAQRRIYYKLIDALDEAVKQGSYEVSLEDDWFGFLKKCKQEVKLAPGILVKKIEELIDAVQQR